MKHTRVIIAIAIIMLGYCMIWGTAWWFSHLAGETWIGAGQIMTIFLSWGAYLILIVNVVSVWDAQDIARRYHNE